MTSAPARAGTAAGARNSSPLRNGFVFQFCKLTTFCSEVSFNLGGKLPHRKGDSALLM